MNAEESNWNKMEQLLNVTEGYASDAVFEGVAHTLQLLQEQIGTILDIETSDGPGEINYEHTLQLSLILLATRTFRSNSQYEGSGCFEDAQEAASDAALRIGEHIGDRTCEARCQIAEDLSGKRYDDLSENEIRLYDRVAYSMILGQLVEG